MSSIQKSYINSITVNSISVDEFSQQYKEWIDNSGILLTEGRKNKSLGMFDSNIWILLNEIEMIHKYLYFNKFDQMIASGTITKDDVTIIKCWIVDSIRDNKSLRTIERMFNAAFNIINLTGNFDIEDFESSTGDRLEQLFVSIEDNSHLSYYASLYIMFLEDIDLATEGHIYILDKLDDIKSYNKSNMRKLPSSKDIFLFQYYLDKFFREETNNDILNFYKPLLLWWKITNVIPMRPSEFANKLYRDCIDINADEYFLHIKRVKVTQKNSERTEARIPLINKVKITKDIYDLVQDYIKCTSFDSETKTLFSYKAMLLFRDNFYKDNGLLGDIKLRNHIQVKKYNDTFTRDDLSTLINSFYEVIIQGKYGDTSIEERLAPGDTRHLAFTSLLLQGVTPIEIAMLGGHTTLEAQNSYTNHVEYYIDSEILDFISHRNIEPAVKSSGLKEIIFNKSYTCPKFIADCYATEDGIGYCITDMQNGEMCDNVETCIFCSKWWCEPTNENYIKAKKYIEDFILNPIKILIEEENTFLNKLFSEVNIINIEGLLEIDKEHLDSIRKTVLKLKSDADRIIFYKKTLLELSNKVESGMDLNEYF